MHVPITLATLALCTFAIVLLRLRWPHLSRRVKRLLVAFAIGWIFVTAIAVATHVSTTFERFNAACYGLSVLCYIFLVVLFTRLRPRWFTVLIAITLLVPLLSASAFLPMAMVFSRQPHHIQALGDHIVSDLTPLDALTQGASGADLTVYRRPAWAPFLQRRAVSAHYLNTQCDSSAAYAVVQSDRRSVLMVCPASPGLPPEEGRSIVLSLYSHK